MEKGAININIDTGKFLNKTLKQVEDAVKVIGYKVIEDVEYGNNAPGVPLDEGTLLGSSHVAVHRKSGIEEEFYVPPGINIGKINKSNITQPNLNGLGLQSARISYNTSYAEEIHEGYDQMIPGEGSRQKFGIPPERQSKYGFKFLERTIKQNQKQYLELFAEVLEDGLA